MDRLKLFHGATGQLNQTVTRFAVLQGLDIIAVERKTLEVGRLRRIAEHSERQIVGQLPKAIEIAGKLDVALRGGMDVDRTEQEHLGWRTGWQGLRDRLPVSDGGDLILAQSDVLPKK